MEKFRLMDVMHARRQAAFAKASEILVKIQNPKIIRNSKTLIAAKRVAFDYVLAKPGFIAVDTQDRLDILRANSVSEDEIIGIVGSNIALDWTVPLVTTIPIATAVAYALLDLPSQSEFAVGWTAGKALYGGIIGIIRELAYVKLEQTAGIPYENRYLL